MFIGHLALGLAAKRAAPRVSLAVLFSAAQFADMLWPVLVAIGVERVRIDPGNTAFTPLDFVSYPYSHSLLALVVWGILFAAVYARSPGPAWLVVGGLVVSHWVLDWVTHRPDMPLFPGGPKLGIGLWNSIPATMATEIAMFVAGVAIYLRTTRARDSIGRWGFGALAAILLIGYVGGSGSAPPSVTALWIAALGATFVLTAWSWWADRHREVRIVSNSRNHS